MVRKHNPIDTDGRVLQHFVVMPSADTPEEILDHYRLIWSNASLRAARLRNAMPATISNKVRGYKEWREAHEEADQAKRDFDLVSMVVESYRFAMGNGLMIPVQGRHGGHQNEDFQRDIPLTIPGYIHLHAPAKNYELLCEDMACIGESIVKDIAKVNCPVCIHTYYRLKRQRKARHKRHHELALQGQLSHHHGRKTP